MIIRVDPSEQDKWMPGFDRTICPFHQEFPEILDYPGCSCTSKFGSRLATLEEQIQNRERRIEREQRREDARRRWGW